MGQIGDPGWELVNESQLWRSADQSLRIREGDPENIGVSQQRLALCGVFRTVRYLGERLAYIPSNSVRRPVGHDLGGEKLPSICNCDSRIDRAELGNLPRWQA